MTYTKNYLVHHDILGQKWGNRNGPPYPLSSSDHSASEKKAGWRKSLDKKSDTSDSSKRKGLTDKQKRIAKNVAIGAGITVGALLLAYGGYKVYKSGALSKLGGDKVKRLLSGESKSSISELSNPNSINDVTKAIVGNPHGTIVNPNRGDPVYCNNCTYVSVASYLRTVLGLDVEARDCGGKPQNLLGVVEDCFKAPPIGRWTLEGSASTFGKNKEAAADLLIRKFGENASGVCRIDFKHSDGDGACGHAFNFSISNGVCTFFDGQDAMGLLNNPNTIDIFWNSIDPNGNFQAARLDLAEINEENIRKYVK